MGFNDKFAVLVRFERPFSNSDRARFFGDDADAFYGPTGRFFDFAGTENRSSRQF
jgi:hypothetical protein